MSTTDCPIQYRLLSEAACSDCLTAALVAFPSLPVSAHDSMVYLLKILLREMSLAALLRRIPGKGV
jgi:hypothetical protein